MHLHIDPVGGIAGDMFAAAILHARPELRDILLSELALLPIKEEVFYSVYDYADSSLCGLRVDVICQENMDHHVHRSCLDIFSLIDESGIKPEIKEGAKAIFAILAGAEAKVHGLRPEDVCFHELGAIDSIVDVVAAAALLHFLDCKSFSFSPLPLGSGLVHSAHGLLPVPAPATALLLNGFVCKDDGVKGERITPTGAAILCYLRQKFVEKKVNGIFQATGLGFGSCQFQGIGNFCRVNLFADSDIGVSVHEKTGVIEFELDDQTPEELSFTAQKLRQIDGVVDLLVLNGFGKKGRPVFSVRILCDSTLIERVAQACFRYSSTIGLRFSVQERYVLPRFVQKVQIDDREIPVKVVERNGLLTAKVEFDEVLEESSLAELRRVSRRAEEQVLKCAKGDS